METVNVDNDLMVEKARFHENEREFPARGSFLKKDRGGQIPQAWKSRDRRPARKHTAAK
jgi:hypothetical protein